MRNVRGARKVGVVAVVLVTASLLASCAGGQEVKPSSAGWIDGAPASGTAGGAASGKSSMAETDGAASTAVAPDAPTTSTPQSAALRAGSVDDNEKWTDYLLYRQEFLRSGAQVHDVDVSGRRIVTVKNAAGHPVLGATVRLLQGDTVLAEAKTHADGRVFLFPPATDASGGQQQQTRLPYRVVVDHGSAHAEVPVTGATELGVTLDSGSANAKVSLDVMFIIDATGSMGDEIEQLKANIVSISDQLAKLPTKPDIRFATTVFRDRGDAFVTRTFDFTSDVGAFQTALRAIEADGGGDVPESVNAAVSDAIHKPSWRGGDTVSLAFLVGDAAPHLDYANDADYAKEVFEAAKRGIKIEPIASSGLDDQGEYIFRQLAELTGGRFSFLTYGAAGAPEPGDSTPNHVKDYSVLSLDDLVVRLVGDELAPLAS
ncbi:MAG: vWA domain-containing protein [Acidimicrobiia bacterium]